MNKKKKEKEKISLKKSAQLWRSNLTWNSAKSSFRGVSLQGKKAEICLGVFLKPMFTHVYVCTKISECPPSLYFQHWTQIDFKPAGCWPRIQIPSHNCHGWIFDLKEKHIISKQTTEHIYENKRHIPFIKIYLNKHNSFLLSVVQHGRIWFG